jgi:hypothetical protein
MELAIVTMPPVPPLTTKYAASALNLVAGNSVKVEVGPEEELEITCPVGKAWFATVKVHIVETDA